ncbi:MAG: DegT/DnrJ/EryC1/StrS aminotransferase, CDP-6-deoxy-D-xylo-4-hexulose-3-dehydrase [Candidatus Peregrinibacteria bacterium GW2011_GWF2_43_17]|nr:MAG: DegT/DnrJ/EryC1/StrS aminotransferase, CDP-6-deoxy-D-xylo-4-hexulose-3-dehydrase [Candidatus Peregrinibacteria bacterium GW2011_GWF2_43_17]KKT19640.1 MAG: DegT/DnrJ/EryC1/StrS aminotransferase [Candidatus Peregrinibacteria bacterium GW2011_GWA2_43_8]HAU40068.1 DegT/DnrJ/EryC1/StrS family aminotransferase [Candidatus Peregrinibacteria bacterium]
MVQKRATQIGVGDTCIDENAKKYVMDALNNNRLSYGKYVHGFEKKFAEGHNVKYAIMSNSGTSSLQVAIQALKEIHGWKDGDEVLVPALTFVATSNVVIQSNLKPVFVEIDPRTYNVDPAKIEEKITPHTRAIMPVNLFGQSCEIDQVLGIAKKHNLKSVEDSCETMFVKFKGKPVGSQSDVACFSTYVAHLLVTGVGGLSTTNSDEYAIAMKSMVNHGRDSVYLHIDDDKGAVRDDKENFFKLVDRRFSFVRMGYSYRVTELEGALGMAQIEKWPEILAARQKNAAYLLKNLKQFEEHLQLPWWPDYAEHAFMMFPIVVKKGAPFSRKDLIMYLEDHNIETRYMVPLLSQPYYIKLFGDLSKEYPIAAHVDENGFYIGCHQGIDQEALDYVLEVFKDFFKTRNSK